MPSTLSRPTALAVVSYWSGGGSKRYWGRLKVLRRVLRILMTFHLNMRLMLVTNKLVHELSDFPVEQVVRSRFQCCGEMDDDRCLPWEAIRTMRHASTGNPQDCDLDTQAACGDLLHDYYIYVEGDIVIPKSTFDFWKNHTDDLYHRSYLLLPHRLERRQDRLTDCWHNECIKQSKALVDASSHGGLYPDPFDKIYLKPGNPQCSCFFMTREQFAYYLASDEWDCLRKNLSAPAYVFSGKRELWSIVAQASGGLVWDPKFGPDRILTHILMPVIHMFPPLMTTDFRSALKTGGFLDWNGTLGYAVPVELFHRLMRECSQESSTCSQLDSYGRRVS